MRTSDPDFYYNLGMIDGIANLFTLIRLKGEKEALIDLAKQYSNFGENPHVDDYLRKISSGQE